MCAANARLWVRICADMGGSFLEEDDAVENRVDSLLQVLVEGGYAK